MHPCYIALFITCGFIRQLVHHPLKLFAVTCSVCFSASLAMPVASQATLVVVCGEQCNVTCRHRCSYLPSAMGRNQLGQQIVMLVRAAFAHYRQEATSHTSVTSLQGVHYADAFPAFAHPLRIIQGLCSCPICVYMHCALLRTVALRCRGSARLVSQRPALGCIEMRVDMCPYNINYYSAAALCPYIYSWILP